VKLPDRAARIENNLRMNEHPKTSAIGLNPRGTDGKPTNAHASLQRATGCAIREEHLLVSA